MSSDIHREEQVTIVIQNPDYQSDDSDDDDAVDYNQPGLCTECCWALSVPVALLSIFLGMVYCF